MSAGWLLLWSLLKLLPTSTLTPMCTWKQVSTRMSLIILCRATTSPQYLHVTAGQVTIWWLPGKQEDPCEAPSSQRAQRKARMPHGEKKLTKVVPCLLLKTISGRHGHLTYQKEISERLVKWGETQHWLRLQVRPNCLRQMGRWMQTKARRAQGADECWWWMAGQWPKS